MNSARDQVLEQAIGGLALPNRDLISPREEVARYYP